MPKLKTHKTISKRFKLTKKGKLIRRAASQDHFNSKDSGSKVTKKRRDLEMTNPKDKRTITELMPYA